MNKVVTLSRDGKTRKILVRQCPHDAPVAEGKKFKYGSGKRWTILAVEPCEE